MRSYEITIKTEFTPGHATFDNYHEVKGYLEKELYAYNQMVYSMDNIDQAIADYAVLKSVRKKLTEKRKELERAYTMPIEEVMCQLDELIDMVKAPFTVVDRFLKAHEKDIKQREIMKYAYEKSGLLGIYANNVLSSSAFFNPRWPNKSYNDRQWKNDVNQIIQNAYTDIRLIKAMGGEHENALLAFYFDKLSMNGVDVFLETLTGNAKRDEPEKSTSEVENASSDTPESDIIIDPVTGEIFHTWNNGTEELGNTQIAKEEPIPSPGTQENPSANRPPIVPQEKTYEIMDIIVKISGEKNAVMKYTRDAYSYGVKLEEIDKGSLSDRTEHKPISAEEVIQERFEQLRRVRLNLAKNEGLPAYCICHNTVLRQMALYCPQTKEDLAGIKGIGPRFIIKYGDFFLQAINTFSYRE